VHFSHALSSTLSLARALSCVCPLLPSFLMFLTLSLRLPLLLGLSSLLSLFLFCESVLSPNLLLCFAYPLATSPSIARSLARPSSFSLSLPPPPSSHFSPRPLPLSVSVSSSTFLPTAVRQEPQGIALLFSVLSTLWQFGLLHL